MKFEYSGQTTPFHHGDTLLFGQPCYSGTPIEEVARQIEDTNTADGLINIFANCMGFYAAITTVGDSIALVTDQIGSIPLFYSKVNGELIVSDFQNSLVTANGTDTYDSTNSDEYRSATFISGRKTLHPNIKQTRAGMITLVDKDNTIEKSHYQYQWEGDEQRSYDELDAVLDNVFKRLTEVAEGRPIWISLSGGRDSRLALLKLLELEYSNLSCWTFGAAGNVEIERARYITRKLDVPWSVIEYDDELWQEALGTKQWTEYKESFHRHTVPSIKTFPAVYTLHKKTIPRNAIIISGNSADFLAGSHLKSRLLDSDYVSHSKLVEYLLEKHYEYAGGLTNQEAIEHVATTLSFSGGSGEEAAEAAERWNWRERQSKYILSQKLFEWFDYEWWIPFWDRKFMDFWCTTPLSQRMKKSFYNDFVDRKWRLHTGEPAPEQVDGTFTESMKEFIGNSTLWPYLRPLYNAIKNEDHDAVTIYESDPYKQFSVIDESDFNDVYNGDQHIRAYAAREVLGEISWTNNN